VTLRTIRSVGTLDRTGVVQAALSRVDSYRFDELDVVRPGDLDACDVDVDVLVVGSKELSAAGLRRIGRWRRAHPVSVTIAHVNGTPMARSELSEAGITQAVRGPLTTGKLRTALHRADGALWNLLDAAERHGFTVADDHFEDLESVDESGEIDEIEEILEIGHVAAEPALDDRAEDDLVVEGVAAADTDPGTTETGVDPTMAARVITVASATGGCGKTFFATSAATVLARMGRRVLLVDLDLQFGEVAAALQIHHPYSVYDGLYRTNGERLDESEFDTHLAELVCHHELGFDVLTAPRDPALADYVGARDAAVVLDAVDDHYDVVIVDTPPSLNDVVIAALDRSDLVAVLATPDVPSLRNLTAFTDVLQRLGLEDERLRLVLNKVDSDVGVTAAQANEAFGGRFRTILPADRAVSRAVNRGTTVPAHEPRAKISRALLPAVAALADELGLPQHPDRPLVTREETVGLPLRRMWRAVFGGSQ
jgi:Flp pilus assembly CpaE family ATPase